MKIIALASALFFFSSCCTDKAANSTSLVQSHQLVSQHTAARMLRLLISYAASQDEYLLKQPQKVHLESAFISLSRHLPNNFSVSSKDSSEWIIRMAFLFDGSVAVLMEDSSGEIYYRIQFSKNKNGKFMPTDKSMTLIDVFRMD